MKHLGLFVLVISGASSSALANGYCDTRQNKIDYDRCYASAIDMRGKLLAQSYDRLLSIPPYNMPEQRESIQKNRATWWSNVQASCGNSGKCFEESLISRTNQVNDLYNKAIKQNK